GVDSTLLHTYLGASVPSVSAALTSREFQFEIDYAATASGLLGTQHRFARFEEHAYLAELERCVEGMCMPPHHLQTVLVDAVFRSPGARFITGQFADSLFGMDVAATASRIWRLRRLWWQVARTPFAARTAAASGLSRLQTLVN